MNVTGTADEKGDRDNRSIEAAGDKHDGLITVL
jgi:hypothetical protein